MKRILKLWHLLWWKHHRLRFYELSCFSSPNDLRHHWRRMDHHLDMLAKLRKSL